MELGGDCWGNERMEQGNGSFWLNNLLISK